MRDEKTLYEVLGVAESATTEEIKRAARKLLQTHHPDRGGNAEDAARINEASATLTDTDRRADYDLTRSSPAPEPGPAEDLDDWATPEGDEEEELDFEVHETPPTPDPAPTPPPPVDAEPEPEAAPAIRVVTAGQRAIRWALLPALALLALILGAAQLNGRPGAVMAATIGAVAGVIVGLVAARKLPPLRTVRAYQITMSLLAALVLVLMPQVWVHDSYVSAIQAAVTGAVAAILVAPALRQHSAANRVIDPKALTESGTIFGQSTGQTSDELLNDRIWRILARPGFEAARAYQVGDPTSAFTKAVILGNRVALLRPVLANGAALRDPYLYWSTPWLFARDAAGGTPEQVARFDLAPVRTLERQFMPKAQVQEFAVIYSTSAHARFDVPGAGSVVPVVVNQADVEDAVASFLKSDTPVTQVEHANVSEMIRMMASQHARR